MDLSDSINDIASKVSKQQRHIITEEATKTALIMPFINALGYDVFNPLEVIPEYTADSGTKKGEKVDYAIKKDDKIIILIECKWSGEKLQKNHTDQLFRYFSVTDARFAILTNGINYEFYSDIEKPNTMDSKPFFEFNIKDFEDYQLNVLKKFTKSSFSLEDILNTASTLKYTGQIKKILEEELTNPTEEFVRFFARQIYDGTLTKRVLEQFTGIVRDVARKQRDLFTSKAKPSKLGIAEISTSPESPVFELTLKKEGIKATALLEDGEFVVQKGSLARSKYIGKCSEKSDYRRQLYDKLVDQGVLITRGSHKIFSTSYAFSSTSAAGAVCNGRPTAGPVDWKVKETGQTYKDWEAASLAES